MRKRQNERERERNRTEYWVLNGVNNWVGGGNLMRWAREWSRRRPRLPVWPSQHDRLTMPNNERLHTRAQALEQVRQTLKRKGFLESLLLIKNWSHRSYNCHIQSNMQRCIHTLFFMHQFMLQMSLFRHSSCFPYTFSAPWTIILLFLPLLGSGEWFLFWGGQITPVKILGGGGGGHMPCQSTPTKGRTLCPGKRYAGVERSPYGVY